MVDRSADRACPAPIPFAPVTPTSSYPIARAYRARTHHAPNPHVLSALRRHPRRRLPLLNAGPQDDAANRKEVLLAVQRALAQGREYVKAGHYKAAVDVLERELGDFNVFENRDYRRALSDAYIGYVGELKRSNQADEAAVYQRRLSAIDPGAVLELKGPVAKPVAATNPAPKSLLPPPPSVTAAAPDTKGVIARGQANDKDDKGDPFEEANSRGAPDVQDLLERAEREYDAAHYEAAGRLFEQAERRRRA